MPTGYEKMLAGEPYANPDWDLIAMQMAAQTKLQEFNALPPTAFEQRSAMLKDMLGKIGEGTVVLGRINFEYGKHIELGARGMVNQDCLFLDGARITTGESTIIAPRVMFLTATHETVHAKRVIRDPQTGAPIGGYGFNKPITIGSRVWIGAGAIILPGITIGDDCVIGAGSVVTRSIPAGKIAAGNPCRILRDNV